jgi:diguanylate cyclase (GGDEF)-like protein
MHLIFIFLAAANLLIADTLTFGVFAYKSTSKIIEEYQPIADHLSKELNSTIIIKALSQKDLEEQVTQEKIDIIATNPTHFLSLRYKGRTSGAIATEVKKYGTFFIPYLGGVIVTRSDRHDIRTLRDLKGKVIAIPGYKFLGGFQTQYYEFDKQGIDLKNNCTFVEVGNHNKVIKSVLDGKADAGFVRTGIIEEMSEDKKVLPSNLFVINQRYYKNFPLITSTELYPEWAITTSDTLSVAKVKKIAIALYNYESESQKRGTIDSFTIPADYSNIDRLARALRLPPYEKAPDFTLMDIWDKYKYWIVLLSVSTIIIAILLIILIRINGKLHHTSNELSDLAVHDPLTGLFNRRGMMERLKFLLAELKRNKKNGAIIYIDLDNFKPLNDSYGHAIGDELLIQVSKRLQVNVRSIDTVSRMGGDEFLVILSHLEPTKAHDDASLISEKLRVALNEPFTIVISEELEINYSISTSIGMVIFDEHHKSDTVIIHADAAMYKAKAQGRNRVIIGELG